MKVLHVIPSVSPLRGGPSFVIRTMTRNLAERGIEVHVATTDDNGLTRLKVPLNQPVREGDVVYWYFPRQTRFYTFSFPFTTWLWRHARDYDLIHIHFLFSYCSNTAGWIARVKGVPYIIRPLGVLNRWGRENRRPRLKRLSIAVMEGKLLRAAALVHYTAEQERLEASELGFPHNSVIIPNPVELPHASRSELQGRFRARYPQLAKRPIILFLSRIDRKKGLDLLILAFRQVMKQYPEAVLVVAGDGDRVLVDALKSQAQQCGIENSILWVGFLGSTEKCEALADAEMFVLPSHSENFGIAIVEAMALGVPVVITDQVGIHGEVSDHNAGIVIRPEVDSLTVAILKLLSDVSLRVTLGQNGVALVRSDFALATVITKLEAVYHRILGDNTNFSGNAATAVHRI
jgi:glycosyltransferase involved in cell wall biosynthesis